MPALTTKSFRRLLLYLLNNAFSGQIGAVFACPLTGHIAKTVTKGVRKKCAVKKQKFANYGE